jgi:hypothetical protein
LQKTRRPRQVHRKRPLVTASGAQVRTSNDAERAVVSHLIEAGYEVHRRGWPDLLVTKGDEVRFIEVKPATHRQLSPEQERVAQVLAALGINVELMTPNDLY